MIPALSRLSPTVLFSYCTKRPADTVQTLLQNAALDLKGFQEVKKAARSFSLETIQTSYDPAKQDLEQAKSMFSAAKYYLEVTERTMPSQLKRQLRRLLDTSVTVTETFLSSFGLASFFKQTDSDVQAEQKVYRVSALISSFALLLPAISSVLGPSYATFVVGALFLFISALSLLYPHIRPVPSAISRGENYSKQLLTGKLSIEIGRESYHKRIADILTRDKRPKHAMLVGKPGVGKNELAKSFVKAVSDNAFPELAGKTVFYFNTANFIKASDSWGALKNPLKEISDAMGRNRNNIILLFDEIQSICTGKSSEIGQKLLTLLDVQAAGFPYVIGITTDEQMKQIERENPPLASRFEQVNIKSTDETETLAILNRTFLQQPARPALFDTDSTIRELYTKTRSAFAEKAEPAMSLKILRSCLQRTGRHQRLPIDNKIERVRAEIDAQDALTTVRMLSGRVITPVKASHTEYDQLQQVKQEHSQLVTRFFCAKETLERTQKSLCKTAIKIVQMPASHTHKQQAKFTLLNNFAERLRKEIATLKTACEQVGINTTIDSKLITAVLAEEQEKK